MTARRPSQDPRCHRWSSFSRRPLRRADCMAVGFTMERVAYRPLRGAPRLAPLITGYGISIILQKSR